MGLLSIIESLSINIFCKPKKKKDAMANLYKVSENYKLSILPISHSYELENLYPITNKVKEWNTFVVGNDKTYILSNIGDKSINKNLNEELFDIVDTKGIKLPSELFKFFDSVWTTTLEGNQLQFYIVLNGGLYLLNTYCIRNETKKIIGAIAFMRDFDNLPDVETTQIKAILASKNNLNLE